MGTTPWRTTASASKLESPLEYLREVVVLAYTLGYAMQHNKPRSTSDKLFKPCTAMAFLHSVNRVHRRNHLASETGFRKGELFASNEESHFLQWDAISVKLQGKWIPANSMTGRYGHLCSLAIVLQSPCPTVKLTNSAWSGVPSLATASFSQLGSTLFCLLSSFIPAAAAKIYTWHNFRISLACALLVAKCSNAQIQAVLR